MVNTITGDTPLFQLTVNQLLGLLEKNDNTVPVTKAIDLGSKSHVYGLGGLARLLNCSHPTAQRIKNSGKIPYTQVGRKLIFDADAVLNALRKK
jgi:excisionase family DNA binding protein